MMMTQVVLAVESIERSRQLLADGRLREAFLVARQARDASGLSPSLVIINTESPF